MIHAMIAGREIENVLPNRILIKKIVAEQKSTFGEVSEWLYRGKNSMTKVKKNTTGNKSEKRNKTKKLNIVNEIRRKTKSFFHSSKIIRMKNMSFAIEKVIHQ